MTEQELILWKKTEKLSGAAADQEKGLTSRGKELIQELLRQEIVLDVSHLSDKGVEDILTLTEKPVIASHFNVRKIQKVPRNLPDTYIKEIIRRKGLIGINFYADFVGAKPKAEDIFRHMDAVLELGGEDVLALGGDFDGSNGRFPTGIEGVQSIPFLREKMLQHGFTEELTEKIFYGNAHRFVMENVK